MKGAARRVGSRGGVEGRWQGGVDGETETAVRGRCGAAAGR